MAAVARLRAIDGPAALPYHEPDGELKNKRLPPAE
jgi:hypothetical protein